MMFYNNNFNEKINKIFNTAIWNIQNLKTFMKKYKILLIIF